MSYEIVIDNRRVVVYAADSESRYEVRWEGLRIGYVYISAFIKNDGRPIWLGSTPLLNRYATIIGGFIERSDCGYYSDSSDL